MSEMVHVMSVRGEDSKSHFYSLSFYELSLFQSIGGVVFGLSDSDIDEEFICNGTWSRIGLE